MEAVKRQSGGIYTVGGNNITMTVVFRKSAGISNPTEAGTFPAKITLDELEIETSTEISVSCAEDFDGRGGRRIGRR